MRLRSYIFAAALLCCLAVGPVLHASIFTLGQDPNQLFNFQNTGENVGPYPGTLTGSNITNFFCLDYTLTATFGTSYAGTVAAPTTPQEEEAAFLAAYAIYQGSPSSTVNAVNLVEGPISFAIWQIMGTLGTTPPDHAVQQFVQTAQFAFSHNLIPQAFLNNVLIFKPANNQTQRFITAVPNNGMVSPMIVSAIVSAAVPEPRTTGLVAGAVLVGAALLLLKKRVGLHNRIVR